MYEPNTLSGLNNCTSKKPIKLFLGGRGQANISAKLNKKMEMSFVRGDSDFIRKISVRKSFLAKMNIDFLALAERNLMGNNITFIQSNLKKALVQSAASIFNFAMISPFNTGCSQSFTRSLVQSTEI